MPCGLQCWDATGKLVVDIGDYNTRYLGGISSGMPANVGEITVTFAGLTASGSFAVISAVTTEPYKINHFATRVYDGGCRVFKLPSYTSTVNFNLEFYSFI